MTDRRAVIAVDVGGTTIKAGILGPSGLYDLRRVPSNRTLGAEAVVMTVADVARDLYERSGELQLDTVGACIAVPGIIDEDHGVGRLSVTIGWRDMPVGDRVSERVPCPVVVRHDVRAGALAETSFGAAVGASSAVFLPIGTGIAAALVVDGHVVSGFSFQAGELGQIMVKAPIAGAATGDPAMVTLEAASSARAIGERYCRAAGLPVGDVDAEDVATLVAHGDGVAGGVWAEAIDRLGNALAMVIATVDPAVVVIGGGLSRAGDVLIDPLSAAVASFLPWRQPPRMDTAYFADDAGFVGAAINAWQHVAGAELASLDGVLGDGAWRRPPAGQPGLEGDR